MTREDIDNIIKIICPNDEDFEKPIISPAYLKNELEALALEQEPCDNAVSRQDVLDLAKKGILISNGNYESVCKAINELPPVNPQNCDNCEVGNPCLYCKHEFEPQERSDKE